MFAKNTNYFNVLQSRVFSDSMYLKMGINVFQTFSLANHTEVDDWTYLPTFSPIFRNPTWPAGHLTAATDLEACLIAHGTWDKLLCTCRNFLVQISNKKPRSSELHLFSCVPCFLANSQVVNQNVSWPPHKNQPCDLDFQTHLAQQVDGKLPCTLPEGG